jgi:LysR family glycine cleavage system transcriptional activator
MARSLPPLNALRAFEAAGRLGSFTKAAIELNVSHSAISRHVRGLEKRLDVHLFRTLNTGVALTDQGRAYLASVTPALDQIAQATEALTTQPRGTVTLTTESAVAQESGAELLFPCIVRAYAAPGFAPIADGKLDLAALAGGPLIEEATFRLWPEWFKRMGLGEVPNLDLPHPLSALLAIQSAAEGLGAVLMDEHLCEPERKSGALVELSAVAIPFGGYYLAVNSRAARRKAVRAVRQWLIDESAGSEA